MKSMLSKGVEQNEYRNHVAYDSTFENKKSSK